MKIVKTVATPLEAPQKGTFASTKSQRERGASRIGGAGGKDGNESFLIYKRVFSVLSHLFYSFYAVILVQIMVGHLVFSQLSAKVSGTIF